MAGPHYQMILLRGVASNSVNCQCVCEWADALVRTHQGGSLKNPT